DRSPPSSRDAAGTLRAAARRRTRRRPQTVRTPGHGRGSLADRRAGARWRRGRSPIPAGNVGPASSGPSCALRLAQPRSPRARSMTVPTSTVFLLDVDNTLLDNDAV